MPFWVYMLHCRDRTFYVGHTEDLDVRLAQHRSGTFGGYTARKRPVTLVWSGEFPTRDEALEFERRVKGWRRDKKLALIRRDWEEISRLSEGKGQPLTGSGRAGLGGSAQPDPNHVRFLHPHLSSLPSEPLNLEVSPRWRGDRLDLHYRLTGSLDHLALPSPSTPERKDELWRHTCFEAFVRLDDAPGYFEFNFAPSGHWAAYRFEDYRTDMAPAALELPRTRWVRGRHALELDVRIRLPAAAERLRLNLAAVIEEGSGAKSYWALAHPPEGPPDFHHPDCFALELPAARRA